MFKVLDQHNIYKYTSRCKAIVIDNKDPLAKNRIRVDTGIIGPTNWVPYLKTPGLFDLPEVNDIVYVEADSGNYNYIVAWGNLGIKSNSIENTTLKSAVTRHNPTAKALFTPKGNFILLDDGANESGVGSPAGNTSTLNISSSSGNQILIDDVNDFISLTDQVGNNIKISYGVGDVGITINSTKNVTVQAQNNVNVNCNNATISASDTAIVDGTTIKLGASAVESVIKGNTFESLFNLHTHNIITPSPGSPTTPPTIPLTGTELSTKVKTE